MASTPLSQRLKPFLFRAVALSISLFFAFLLCEIGTRLIAPQTLALNYTEWDPYIGFKNKANASGFFRSAEFTMEVRINTTGQRDREVSLKKTPGTYRIVVLGDSFTFGHGVAEHEAYTKQVEKILKQDFKKPVECVNMGVGKSGTAHELALWRKIAKNYESDLVLVGFYVGNDFTDNAAGVFRLEQGKLVHQATRYSSIRRMQSIAQAIPFYSFLAEHSHFVNLIRSQLTQFDDRTRQKEANKDALTPDGKPAVNSKELDFSYEISQVELQVFAKEVTESGRAFGVVFIPSLGGVTRGASTGPDVYDRMTIRFREFVRTTDIKSIDLEPTFIRLRKEHGDKRWYYEGDQHWTPIGHHAAAEEIAKWVVAEFLK